jgi:LysR family transcriptional regulator, transcriptional activator of nhaA
MEWLNYHHLYYFWTVARTGTVTKASEELRLSPPTISAQLGTLEESLGEKLFMRSGRKLVLTDMGHAVFAYADQIFKLGRRLQDAVKDGRTGNPLRLSVGITDVVPKAIVYRLIEPIFELGGPVRIACREASFERLLAELGTHELDLVISDEAVAAKASIRAYNHFLGEAGVVFMADRKLAMRYRRGFPRSLDGAPLLLPTEHAGVRRSLDQWFYEHGVQPRVVGEFQDYALLRIFGEAGKGIFPVPSLFQGEMKARYHMSLIGKTDTVFGRFYAISTERRLTHPGVIAICGVARAKLRS